MAPGWHRRGRALLPFTAAFTAAPTAALAAALALASGCGDDDGGPADTPITPAPAHCGELEPITCAVDIGATLPLRLGGTTVGAEDSYGGARCGLGGDTIEDAAFRWTVPRDDSYEISTEGSGFDTFLSLRQGSCAGREIACNDDASEGESHSTITLDLAECATVTIVIDGRDVDAVGAFRLSIHGTEKSCDDGVDDDGDGATDCDDDDCFGRECPGEDLWPTDWAGWEWEVLDLVNMRRAEGASCGGVPFPPVSPLEMNTELRLAARLHSEDMADNSYFSHDSPDGRMLGDRVAEAGFRGAGPIGENILAGTADPAGAVEGWMSSTGHCENIMNPAFHVTGIGYSLGDGGHRWTQDFGGSH